MFLIPTVQTETFHLTHACFQVFRSSKRVIKNYSFLGKDTIFLGECFMKFWRNTLTSCSIDEFLSIRNFRDEGNVQLQNGYGTNPSLDTVSTSQKTQVLICMLYNLSRNNYKLSQKHS